MSRKDSAAVPSAQVPDEDPNPGHNAPENQQKPKRKRNKPGNPDPRAKVIALSAGELLAKVDYICEICRRVFQTKERLQVHHRSHSIPWIFQRRDRNDPKPVYVCPEPTCIHHDPLRALRHVTGIKKHYSRKHRERNWQCDKCRKMYAVEGDLKAHGEKCSTCLCDCGCLFPSREEYDAHRQQHESKTTGEEMRSPNLALGPASNVRVDVHHCNEPPELNDGTKQNGQEVANVLWQQNLGLLLWLSQQNPSSNHPSVMEAPAMEYYGGDPLPPIMSVVESSDPPCSTNQTHQAGVVSGPDLISATRLQHWEVGTGAAAGCPSFSSFFGGSFGSMDGPETAYSSSPSSYFYQVFDSMERSQGNELQHFGPGLQFFGQDPVVGSSFPFEILNVEADCGCYFYRIAGSN